VLSPLLALLDTIAAELESVEAKCRGAFWIARSSAMSRCARREADAIEIRVSGWGEHIGDPAELRGFPLPRVVCDIGAAF
jgi:hypothetical protein